MILIVMPSFPCLRHKYKIVSTPFIDINYTA